MSNSDDNTLHFEEKFGEFSKLGTLIIKGTADRRSGNLTGEIGVKAFGVYKSLKPFAGNLHDGVHGKFATGVGFGDSSFSIGVKDGAVHAQANLWEKGVDITLFKLEELETTWDGMFKIQDIVEDRIVNIAFGRPDKDYILWFDKNGAWHELPQTTFDVVGTAMEKPNQTGGNPEKLRYTASCGSDGIQISLANGASIKGKPVNMGDRTEWIPRQEYGDLKFDGECEYSSV